MPLLFSYGPLQQEAVQLATVGRRLNGHRNKLVGFVPSLVKIEDAALAERLGRTHHADAALVGDRKSRVPGMAFEVAGLR